MKNNEFRALSEKKTLALCYLNSNRSFTTSKNHVEIKKEMDLKLFTHVVYKDVKFLHH